MYLLIILLLLYCHILGASFMMFGAISAKLAVLWGHLELETNQEHFLILKPSDPQNLILLLGLILYLYIPLSPSFILFLFLKEYFLYNFYSCFNDSKFTLLYSFGICTFHLTERKKYIYNK